MTKEEQIDWLCRLRADINNGVIFTPWNKEFTEALTEVLEQQLCEDTGELSDGYHTFNQLYHQRAILFACIVRQNKNKAWKSFKHSDGKYCFDSNGEWFIVGVDTPQGCYTYHYAKEYWDMFDCKELECGKEWDGHTEEDIIRLLSLEQQPSEDVISREDAINAAIDAVDDCNISRATMIRNAIKKLPSVTPKQSFINKPCISEGVCHEDKVDVLKKIRAEIENHCGLAKENHCRYCSYCNNVMGVREILKIIDKYKAESEEQNESRKMPNMRI